ncbi:MAG TPA: hydrogenase expression/formation protein HypE [Thermoanaerobaculaceae bacterium]|nr:hydrogenase expression/formation protein HypE [Thermoanaerobaculaceae bacterium]HRS15659.1 hydrogenase expression/formation protein HypE [Thermoanaerobaculaceae bacterium]
MRKERILLAHGGGGRLMQELIRGLFVPAFSNPVLATLSDAALPGALPPGRPAFTTDAFVVEPSVFPGGDLGYLAVCGTVNDLAVAGATPLWLSFAVILEEGLEVELLRTFVAGAARAAGEAGVQVVAGDTKVVPKGKADGAFIVTAGVGVVPPGVDLGDHRIAPGDAVLVSGPVGEHGATVMACRHHMAGAGLRSDCAPLGSLAAALRDGGVELHAMHDPTRGGLATTCHEAASRAGVRIVLEQEAVPVRAQVAAVCELLGLDPLYVACEGRLLAWVRGEDAEHALSVLRAHPRGVEAAVVGRVEARLPEQAPVVLRTPFGSVRVLDLLAGSELPRIC